MSVPRFLFLATSGTNGRGGADDRTTGYLWRLVAGNNHVLGRSPAMCNELEQCRQSISWLVENLAEGIQRPAPGSRPGHWSWLLVLPNDQQVLAISARGYERQRESRSSLENFRAAVPVAVVVDTVAVRPGARRLVDFAPQEPTRGIPGQSRTGSDTSQPRTGAPAGAGSPLPPE